MIFGEEAVMLFLCNTAARVGYIDSILNTLHLPKGSESIYQYSIESGSYVHANALQPNINEEVLIVFINKDANPYQFIPLRKARLLDLQTIDGRIYFTVILGDYCIPIDNNYDKFNTTFIETFGELVFRENAQEAESKADTKERKNNKGFLVF